MKHLGVLLYEHISWNEQVYQTKLKQIKQIMQKLQNRALIKINFKKCHHPIKHIYKDHKILKFADILKVQNCLFMYKFEQNSTLATSFPTLHSKDKHNYQTRSATQNLLDIPLARTNKYGKGSGITSKRSSHKYQKTNCLI